MFIQKRRSKVTANEELDMEMDDTVVGDVEDVEGEGDADVVVDPEASDLLFEAEDVAELIAEVTGETVEVTADDDFVEFAVGDDVFTVEAEGDEEILEAATKRNLRGKRTVAASTRRAVPQRKAAPKRTVAASTKATGRAIRRVPKR